MRSVVRIQFFLVALAFGATALGASPVVYPSKGQTAAKQAQDDAECNGWAKTNTGVDPAALAAAPAPPPPKPAGGQVVKGAAVGAGVGAVVGGDSKGAATGAAVGAVGAGVAARKKQQAQAGAAQQQQSQKEQAMATYYRAYGACMTGRGYTVN